MHHLRALAPFLSLVLSFATRASAQEVATVLGANSAPLFGQSVSRADINNDGVFEAVIGAPGDSTAFPQGGAVSVYDSATFGVLLTLKGHKAGELFGYAVAGIGDANGDGFDDIVVGAPGDDANGKDSGSIYVYSGKDGSQLFKRSGDFAGDAFGQVVAGVGDVNNDGKNDFGVGAPVSDAVGGNAGYARIFGGGGSTLHTFYGDNPGDHLGTSIARLLDINGDGNGDFIVGSPYGKESGATKGLAHVYSGASMAPMHTFYGDHIGDQFGAAVSRVPGGPIAVGAPNVDTPTPGTGRVYIYDSSSFGILTSIYFDLGGQCGTALAPAPFSSPAFCLLVGSPHGGTYHTGEVRLINTAGNFTLYTLSQTNINQATIQDLGKNVSGLNAVAGIGAIVAGDPLALTGAPGATMHGLTVMGNGWVQGNDPVGEGLGTAISGAGDVDHDGRDDFAVGCPAGDGSVPGAGLVRIYGGQDVPSNPTPIREYLGDQSSSGFGSAVALAGDVNGDGRDDLIIGAPHYKNGAASDAGAAFVYSGKNAALLYSIVGNNAGDQLGSAVAGNLDADGDGFEDFIVASPFNDLNGTDAGRVRVYSGATGTPLYSVFGDAAGDQLGTRVVTIGDVDNDGISDFAASAPYHVFAGSSGYVRVYSGATGVVIRTLSGFGTLNLGRALGGARDVDGDGVPDVIAGARNQGTGIQPTDRGAALVFSGATGALVRLELGAFAYEQLGTSVAILGDVDKDGFAEFAAGTPNTSQIFLTIGVVKIFNGSDGSLRASLFGENVGDGFGAAIARVADATGDGTADFVVGAPRADVTGADSGYAVLYDFAPKGLTTYGTGTPGCAGAEFPYGNSTPAVGNAAFRLSCKSSPPNSLSLGLVCNAQMITGWDFFGLGILMQVNLYASSEIYTFNLPTDANGHSGVAAPIPNSPFFAGKHYYAQAISAWPASTCVPSIYGLSASLGLDIAIP